MKAFCLSFILILALSAGAQKYALIDSKLKIPVVYTDSVTVEQIKKGFYPVEKTAFDTLAANLRYLEQMLSVRQRAKMQSFQLNSGNAAINVKRVPYAYGDRYTAKMDLLAGNIKGQWLLVSHQISNAQNASNLKKLSKYLQDNKLLFRSPNEITPKLTEVVVISD